MPIRVFAPAKINLNLHICGKRSDGYHILHSLVTFAADIGDWIETAPSDTLTLEIKGPFSHSLKQESIENNLIIRAARLLAGLAEIEPKAHIILEKNLPVASGIGGGSSDAATTVKALCSLWNIMPDAETLSGLLTGLGADLPVCLNRKTVIMEGIGEKITPYSGLPPLSIVLINPLIACQTQQVFKNFNGEFSAPVLWPEKFSNAEEFADFARTHLHNDLQNSAIRSVPDIKKILEKLTSVGDCLYSGLSGSGATCFGIFADAKKAQKNAKLIKGEFPEWWIVSGNLENK